MKVNLSSNENPFLTGLVFGFDVGTGSIGYAVRRGSTFLPNGVGVLICDSEGSDLSKRRDLRRQRRTLRSKKYRREWFAKELEKLGLRKPMPPLNDPITLRVRALNGEALKPEELHAALTHLFKRRGYSKVPWANEEKPTKETAKSKKPDELGEIKKAVKGIRKEMAEKNCKFPCELLAIRLKEQELWREHIRSGKPLTELWPAAQMKGDLPKQESLLRKIYWPREFLRDEFLAIAKAQKENKNFPRLADNADKLLYGDSQPKQKNGETFHVYFKTTEARNPGVLGLCWPRFDNRGPALDSLQPVDEQGRPLHVVRKNKPAYISAQWAMALLNLRVQDPKSRKKFTPSSAALAKLREVWEKQQVKNTKRKTKKAEIENETDDMEVTITRAVLKQWVTICKEELNETFDLVEGQRDLTPKTGAGRARFSSRNLAKLQKDIEAGKGMPPIQTILRRKKGKSNEIESNEEALDRYLRDIKHPLVRHRLALIRKLISDPKDGLIARFGVPDCIVVEAVRKLAMSDNAKRRLLAWQNTHEEETDSALTFWREHDNASPRKKSLERWKLWRELRTEKTRASRCPYCLQPIVSPADPTVEVEHIVPYRRVFCDEFFNKTVAHRDCNQAKSDKTPYEAFANNPSWPVRWENKNDPDDPDTIVGNARLCFRREFHFSYQHTAKINGKEVTRSRKDSAVNSKTKLDLFISPNAEALIEEKSDLVQTAYIAKVLRHVSLLLFDRPNRPWLKADGSDPTDEKGNHPSRCYLVTNGKLTKELRREWGLNQILHKFPSDAEWNAMSPEKQAKKKMEIEEKNRGDLRHHALDAMVIACTLPWLAHRTHGATDEFGNHGWWTQDEKQRSKAANPLFPNEGQMHEVVKKEIEKVVVRHHVSRSNHGKKLDTTPLALRVIDVDEKRKEVFVARRPLREKSPDAIKDIFSVHLKTLISSEWAAWSQLNPEWDKENKGPSKGKFPARFIAQLIDPIWKKPIRSVKFIVEKSRSSVFKVGEHPTGQRREIFVAYGENKEVNVFARTDGKGFIAQPIRPCYAKGESPQTPVGAAQKVFTLRRGTLFRLNGVFKIGKRELHPDIYRVVALPGEADARVSFFSHYQNAAAKDGVRPAPIRADVEKIAGHITILTRDGRELPHPPSVKSQSESPHQA